MKKIYYIYMLQCINGAYYTGYTTNLLRRYQAHVAGKAAKYTRAFPPQSLAVAWQVETTLSGALRIEAFLKKHSRLEKQSWVKQPDMFITKLAELEPYAITVCHQ